MHPNFRVYQDTFNIIFPPSPTNHAQMFLKSGRAASISDCRAHSSLRTDVPPLRNRVKDAKKSVPDGGTNSVIFLRTVKTAEPLILVAGDLVRKKNCIGMLCFNVWFSRTCKIKQNGGAGQQMGLISIDPSADHILFGCSQILSNIPLIQLPQGKWLPRFMLESWHLLT